MGTYKYQYINAVRTKLLLEMEKDLNFHIKKTYTKINHVTIKEFEKKYQDLTINIGNEYFNCRNNEINHGKKVSIRFSDKDTFKNIIKIQKFEKILIKNLDKNTTLSDNQNRKNTEDYYAENKSYLRSNNINDENINMDILNNFNKKNISERKNKKFQEYISKIKTNLNQLEDVMYKKINISESGNIYVNTHLDELIKERDLKIYSKNQESCKDINKGVNSNSKNNNFKSDKISSINNENFNYFNTLISSKSPFNNIYNNQNKFLEKQKIIENCIMKIPNKSNSKYIYHKIMYNPLIYKNNKQMKKKIKQDNQRIGYNYLNILTKKLKKIKDSKNDKDDKYDNNANDKKNQNDNNYCKVTKNEELEKVKDKEKIFIKDENNNKNKEKSTSNTFHNNENSNEDKENNLSNKLSKMLFESSNKKILINNEILKDFPMISQFSSKNFFDISSIIINNKSSNNFLNKFFSSKTLENVSNILNQRVLETKNQKNELGKEIDSSYDSNLSDGSFDSENDISINKFENSKCNSKSNSNKNFNEIKNNLKANKNISKNNFDINRPLKEILKNRINEEENDNIINSIKKLKNSFKYKDHEKENIYNIQENKNSKYFDDYISDENSNDFSNIKKEKSNYNSNRVLKFTNTYIKEKNESIYNESLDLYQEIDSSMSNDLSFSNENIKNIGFTKKPIEIRRIKRKSFSNCFPFQNNKKDNNFNEVKTHYENMNRKEKENDFKIHLIPLKVDSTENSLISSDISLISDEY